jgi:hypothetical protein
VRSMMNYRAHIVVLLLLALLGLGGVAQAQTPDYTVPGTNVVLPGTSGSYGSTGMLVDSAGNTFIGYVDWPPINSNDTSWTVRRFAPGVGGAQTGFWQRRAEVGWKIDDVHMTYSGDDIVMEATVHTFTLPRQKEVQILPPIENEFVYRAGMEYEQGGPNAYQPASEAQQSCPPIDYLKIKTEVSAEVLRLEKLEWGNNGNFRAAIQQKMTDAIGANQVLTVPMFDGPSGNPIVYTQLLNTSYSGAYEAMSKYLPTPTPIRTGTPTPRPTATRAP